MNDFEIRVATQLDFQTILALNQEAIKATAEMDLKQLQQLDDWSIYHKVITQHNQVVAFLLVLPAGKPYQSLNYRWFDNKYQSFYYVDRIVVNKNYAGQRLGSTLYEDLFSQAKANGIQLISCEYNIKPMNSGSQAFHHSFGFQEVGSQWLDNNTKKVSLQVAYL